MSAFTAGVALYGELTQDWPGAIAVALALGSSPLAGEYHHAWLGREGWVQYQRG